MNEHAISVVKPKLTAKERKEERARLNKLKHEAANARQNEQFETQSERVVRNRFELKQLVLEFKAWVKNTQVFLTYRGRQSFHACPCGEGMVHDGNGHFIGVDSIFVNDMLKNWRQRILNLEAAIKNMTSRAEYRQICANVTAEYQRQQNIYEIDGYIPPEAREIARQRLGIEYTDEIDYPEPVRSRPTRIEIPQGCRIGLTPVKKLSDDELVVLEGKEVVQRYWTTPLIGEREDLKCVHRVVFEGILGPRDPCDCPRDAKGVLLPIKTSDDIVVDRSILEAQLEDKAEALRHGLPPYNVRMGLEADQNLRVLGLGPYSDVIRDND